MSAPMVLAGRKSLMRMPVVGYEETVRLSGVTRAVVLLGCGHRVKATRSDGAKFLRCLRPTAACPACSRRTWVR